MQQRPPGADDARQRLLGALDRPYGVDQLFDAISDTVSFLEDAARRYAAVNRTLVARTGRKHKSELIGRIAQDCGYSDHAAFTRSYHEVSDVGSSPAFAAKRRAGRRAAQFVCRLRPFIVSSSDQ